MTDTRDWTPKRRGAIYCAPACGMGCTWIAFNAASCAASNLARSLGDAWEPDVWENLGWHYAARTKCGRWKVHPTIHRGAIIGYTAYLSPDANPGGVWAEHGKTPEKAIAAVKNVARKLIEQYAALLPLVAP